MPFSARHVFTSYPGKFGVSGAMGAKARKVF
jgi:hypothetical protein